MTRARFSPKAERDLEHIRTHIASDNPDAAERVREVILHTADVLAQNRELGFRIVNAGPRHAGIRWFPVPRFRHYLIFYKPLHETVIVIRVLHASQDWKRFFPPSSAR
jgi:toxin ParE1/3/4